MLTHDVSLCKRNPVALHIVLPPKHERTSTYTAVRYVYHELPGMWHEIKCKWQKMPKARANIYVYSYVYSSTQFSGLIFEDEMICIPRTAYSRRCQKDERTSTYTALRYFRFSFWRWNDMYTTNCQVCGTKSSRNSRRCRNHERTSTYTAVRDFPVFPWFCRVWRFHLVVE